VFPETLSPPLVPEEIDEEAPLPLEEVMSVAEVAPLVERGCRVCSGARAGAPRPAARAEYGSRGVGAFAFDVTTAPVPSADLDQSVR
jgi:hypothetical protein